MEAQPLSNIELINKLKEYDINIKFVLYREIKSLDDLNDVLPCILLYELNPLIGHWVALFKNKFGLNYFDPLGNVPDKLLKTSFHNGDRNEKGADYTYLTELLYKDKHKIIFNEIPLQYPSDTNTCGHWCFLRLLFHNISNNAFNECFKHYSAEQRQELVYHLYKKL